MFNLDWGMFKLVQEALSEVGQLQLGLGRVFFIISCSKLLTQALQPCSMPTRIYVIYLILTACKLIDYY